MAIFSFGKKKDDKNDQSQQPKTPPIDQVISMQQQGLTNNQIVQALQRQGYDTPTIMDAMSQADAKRGVEPFQQAPQPQDIPPPTAAPAPPPRREEHQSQNKEQDTKMFEEIAEHIVEEKWQDFEEEMHKMVEWKDQVETRLERMEQSLQDAKADLDNLHKAIVSKIGEYDKNLLDVGTEIKAMEKVFQKVLPELTENVSELSRIAESQKGDRKVSGKKKKSK